MSTFLVVIDKATSVQSLRYGLLNLVSSNKPAELVLLQSPERLPGESIEEAWQATREAVSGARSLLSIMGLPVADAVVGHEVPKKAIANEMTGGNRSYDGIVLTSRSSGLLRFLHFDLAHQLERKYHVPVVTIEPQPADSTVAA